MVDKERLRLVIWRPEEIWLKYCGFLWLNVTEFQGIQEELLMESLGWLDRYPVGKKLLEGKKPATIEDFRDRVPLTTYADYAPFLERRQKEELPQRPHCWAYTTTSSGGSKWVPYTRRAYDSLLDSILAAFILGAGDAPGQVRVGEGEKAIYNVAPRPFLSGYIGQGMVEKFGFRTIPPIDVADKMEFRQRIEVAFRLALTTGVDVVCSLSSVLVRMGESLAHPRRSRRGWDPAWLQPAVLYRLSRAALACKLEGRKIRPRDLWPVKAILGWGLDTSLYRDTIAALWGREPYEFHACTEAGVLALQAWNKKGLFLNPYAAFLEFIPEAEALKMKQDAEYLPRTVLVDGLEPGRRYEVVITSFYGMPFLRYRVGHLMKVLDKEDSETGIRLPPLVFVGRSDEVIDLAGFTRMDERTLGQVVAHTPFHCEEWTARREVAGEQPTLHLYVETRDKPTPEEAETALHLSLYQLDSGYRDMVDMLELKPLRVTLLPSGTFQRYYDRVQKSGRDLFQWAVPHLHARDEVIKELLGSAP